MNKQIFITDFDMKRFRWLIDNSYRFDQKYKNDFANLDKELKNAKVVEPKDIPSDVITMNSKFKIKDFSTNEETIYTLVFPFDADMENIGLSVLAPLGMAVIGYRVGDEIEFEDSSDKRKVYIEEIIYQPEAEGNYYI
jgi:regulator of nucleoside diphosphate kinase